MSALNISVLLATGAMAFSSNVLAAEWIYGYAIQCSNSDSSIRVSARQWDDDFAFQSRGLGRKAKFAFMVSEEKYELSAQRLIFRSVESPLQITLQIDKVEPNNRQGAFAVGSLLVGNQSVSLNCQVRFGIDEDDFDEQNLAVWADSILRFSTTK